MKIITTAASITTDVAQTMRMAYPRPNTELNPRSPGSVKAWAEYYAGHNACVAVKEAVDALNEFEALSPDQRAKMVAFLNL